MKKQRKHYTPEEIADHPQAVSPERLSRLINRHL